MIKLIELFVKDDNLIIEYTKQLLIKISKTVKMSNYNCPESILIKNRYKI
jgi:hypothetical protein